jgi:hypothetical protein
MSLPETDKLDPNLTKPLTDKELPILQKESAENAEPILTKDLTDKELPIAN